MPSLYRPKIVTYTVDGKTHLPGGERVTKDTPCAERSESRAAKWYGRYTDASGRQRREPLSESKEIARRMLAVRAGKAQLNGDGIDADPFAEHRARPLTEHVEDFGRYMAAKGDCTAHVEKTLAQCQAIVAGCGFRHTTDLSAAAVIEYLAALRHGSEATLLPRQKVWGGSRTWAGGRSGVAAGPGQARERRRC
jgi:hypothetical protein